MENGKLSDSVATSCNNFPFIILHFSISISQFPFLPSPSGEGLVVRLLKTPT